MSDKNNIKAQEADEFKGQLSGSDIARAGNYISDLHEIKANTREKESGRKFAEQVFIQEAAMATSFDFEDIDSWDIETHRAFAKSLGEAVEQEVDRLRNEAKKQKEQAASLNKQADMAEEVSAEAVIIMTAMDTDEPGAQAAALNFIGVHFGQERKEEIEAIQDPEERKATLRAEVDNIKQEKTAEARENKKLAEKSENNREVIKEQADSLEENLEDWKMEFNRIEKLDTSPEEKAKMHADNLKDSPPEFLRYIRNARENNELTTQQSKVVKTHFEDQRAEKLGVSTPEAEENTGLVTSKSKLDDLNLNSTFGAVKGELYTENLPSNELSALREAEKVNENNSVEESNKSVALEYSGFN